ncbi:glycosyltransferase [Segetibacter sp. 3557_3]|uniref:glycosyltransferase family 4 protein n=1 Tax=Segetibacter sp. 3557_3 TaxID=2547429 RepID=UPI0010586353|nr:glycosyltransferase family 4 protein [Segetibacter sp. 3557_3]TDH23293.1 glycosyltransferase [Segetibacter sp. 3557_3]
MKILFVALPYSIHTARWISQLNRNGFNVHVFSSMMGHDLHDAISGVTFHENFFDRTKPAKSENTYSSIALQELSFITAPIAKKVIRKTLSVAGLAKSRALLLKAVIEKIRPDIIHSLESQHAGYLVSEVRQMSSGNFPLWIHSNWGIDLHFFGRLQRHVPLLSKMLSMVDVFITEGKRDEVLARKFGFKGTTFTFPSVGGGFNVPAVPNVQPSQRRKILVKGTQDLVRRNLVAIRALERCVDILADYEIVLYSSNEITQAAAELFYHSTGKKITILHEVSQLQMLELNGNAILNICVNMSDGVPNAMLEAMMMGAFPVQSDTSLADEWVEHGKTGMIVPPEDPDVIEKAIRTALSNPELIDAAAIINRQAIIERLNYNNTQNAVVNMYNGELIKRKRD